jgi:4-carboxymuconolactone decarboxylase
MENIVNEVRSVRYLKGIEVRREVLGDMYVDSATAPTDEANASLQELITEFCWGTIWTRPGLERKIRSLVNIGVLTALNRPHELKLHVGGALRTGASEAEIYEVLLQAAVYCGVPAALDAFKVTNAVLSSETPPSKEE